MIIDTILYSIYGVMEYSSSEDSTVSSYRDYEKEAKELVKLILEHSIKVYLADEAKATVEVMGWPTGETFTIDKAEEAIDTLVKVR